MALAISKSSSQMGAFPKALSSIAASVGGLAIFLIIASGLLLSHPVGSRVRGYFYDVDSSAEVDIAIALANQTTTDHSHDKDIDLLRNEPAYKSPSDVSVSADAPPKVPENKEAENNPDPVPSVSSGVPSTEEAKDSPIVGKDSVNVEVNKDVSSSADSVNTNVDKDVSSSADLVNANVDKDVSSSADSVSPEVDKDVSSAPVNKSEDSTLAATTEIPSSPSKAHKTSSDDSGCDLYHGSWFYDSVGPLYTNNTCPVITQMQNCQGNGRPDIEYENWRWKPSQCDLPRFDPKKFLELMRGKTLAFIGDSVARNQMESLLCILWQAEAPKNRGNKRMQRWFFRSTSTMIVRMWSSWLVQQTSEPIGFAPQGVMKLHLDVPDKDIMEFLPGFDVVVLSSGHWFAKQSAYVLDNEIVGGQLWWPNKTLPMKVNNVEAFGISVETIVSAIASHPNYTGITIVRSYSPDHYEGGAWNTGGSCTGKVRPLAVGELVENGFTNIMHEKQVTGFNRGIKKLSNKSKLRLMDITEAFGYRHDGHPGPYRSPDPHKITKRGPDGRPPPQDCLHWCMPGPVDTWNELVLETIRREYEGSKAPQV